MNHLVVMLKREERFESRCEQEKEEEELELDERLTWEMINCFDLLLKSDPNM